MDSRDKVRNIGFIAHIDAGKTTVTERVLFFTKKEHRIGEVHEGTAKMDWMDEERERGITITAACTTVFWKDTCLNIVDTPGHVDFTAEVERSLRILDGVVVVFSGVEGVEAQSETVWHQSQRYNVPKICFVNKLDRVGADFERVVEEIDSKFNIMPLTLQVPICSDLEFTGLVDLVTEKAYEIPEDPDGDIKEIEIPADLVDECRIKREFIVETISEYDDDLLEMYLEGKDISPEHMKPIIKKLTVQNKVAPVLCGSALKNRGVRFLLEAVIDYFPPVSELNSVEGTDRDTGKKVNRELSVEAPFSALAFKVHNDMHGGITYLRIYSGKLEGKGRIYNSTRDRIEKISHIFRMHASHREIIPQAVAGDIVAVAGLKFTVTGDTLATKDDPIIYELLHFPETVISMSIEPSTSEDEAKMEEVLTLISQDDPTFKFRMDNETGQMLVSGMGELHLEVITHRILSDYNLKVRVGKPHVSYRETVSKAGIGEAEFATQIGDAIRYAKVTLKAEPEKRGSGLVFENGLNLPVFPDIYIEAIQQGIKDSVEAGTILGYPVIDIKVTLTDARIKTPGSDEISFRSAASMAFRDALKNGSPVLLEPFMKIVVIAPPEYVGDLINFFNSKRGEIESSDIKKGSFEGAAEMRIIEALSPLKEMFGFSSKFRSITQGRGYFTMEPKEYREIPEKLRKETSFF
ncbi:elongation factor G [Planctomycetota bacterium]